MGLSLSYPLDGKLNGVAPEGRVAFLDLGSSSGALYGPSVSETYPPMRGAGAYVCSNSWGGTFNGQGCVMGMAPVIAACYVVWCALMVGVAGDCVCMGLWCGVYEKRVLVVVVVLFII